MQWFLILGRKRRSVRACEHQGTGTERGLQVEAELPLALAPEGLSASPLSITPTLFLQLNSIHSGHPLLEGSPAGFCSCLCAPCL